jgi:hypothetical protein
MFAIAMAKKVMFFALLVQADSMCLYGGGFGKPTEQKSLRKWSTFRSRHLTCG